MKIFIEGESYPINELKAAFDDARFYNQHGSEGTIIAVGYYHSFIKNQLVYMLPKVFMQDAIDTVFGISVSELLNLEHTETFKHKAEYQWIRQTSVHFYNSLREFKRRHADSSVVQSSLTAVLTTNLSQHEYSYIDLLLSIVNFYKKNKSYIIHKSIDHKSCQIKKTNWDKTIRKITPLMTANKQPVYTEYKSKKKVIDSEEALLTYFLSIVNHFNNEHQLSLSIDKSFTLVKGKKFASLQQNGLRKLKKIKYRYFNDTLKKMYHLCEVYFSQTDSSSLKKKREEFIAVSNYNIVFEDMIDKLLSDEIDTNKPTGKDNNTASLKNLKYNDDGKILDHIYSEQSLLDTSNIFYIGDSKYYKSASIAGKTSRYKQITYAKNVIQYNIDLLNTGECYEKNIRYRDELTEGYNITPNFFIYGYIDDYRNFNNARLEAKDEIVKSYHFADRLFDRDTLFIHQYKINFLYVLKAYALFTENKINTFRASTRQQFRENFIAYFSNAAKCEFKLYEYIDENHDGFVNTNFKLLNGKVFRTLEGKLILAQHISDKELANLIKHTSNIHDFKIQVES